MHAVAEMVACDCLLTLVYRNFDGAKNVPPQPLKFGNRKRQPLSFHELKQEKQNVMSSWRRGEGKIGNVQHYRCSNHLFVCHPFVFLPKHFPPTISTSPSFLCRTALPSPLRDQRKMGLNMKEKDELRRLDLRLPLFINALQFLFSLPLPLSFRTSISQCNLPPALPLLLPPTIHTVRYTSSF